MVLQRQSFEQGGTTALEDHPAIKKECFVEHQDRSGLIEAAINKINLWISEHDGRTNAWWDAQHSWNNKQEEKMEVVHGRITALERRVMFVSGIASGVGAVAGTLLSLFIK